MINIDFINDDNFVNEAELNEISELLTFAYGHLEEEGDAEVSVSFVSNEEQRQRDRRYIFCA